MQYVYGAVYVRLGDIAQYSTERIAAQKLTKENYVGVDNLLTDKRGKTDSEHVPASGMCASFAENDILLGNIRPYLKKIWFADRSGGTNGDVLIVKPKENAVFPKYLYYVLASDRFFSYDVQYSKGAKMPRGNKEAIMNFEFPLPSLAEQERIVSILDRFDKLCNDISDGLPAEIEARRKQYEYYRDKLLRFDMNDRKEDQAKN